MGSLDDDDDGIDDAEVVCAVLVSQLHRGCAELYCLRLFEEKHL